MIIQEGSWQKYRGKKYRLTASQHKGVVVHVDEFFSYGDQIVLSLSDGGNYCRESVDNIEQAIRQRYMVEVEG